jgi:hypothetical protein
MIQSIWNKKLLTIIIIFISSCIHAQQIQRFNPDTIRTIVIDSAINIRSHKLNAQDFIDAMLADTSFYKAFHDMKAFTFVAENRIYTYDKKNKIDGRIYRKIRHINNGKDHKIEYLVKRDSGNVYKKNGKYQLYTIEMFDYVFGNTYKTNFSNTDALTGSGAKNESYKDKLKTLIFEPGRKVKGIPFISSKTEVFSPEFRQFYNFQFARGKYLDTIPVYRFRVVRKSSTAPNDVMINEMTTIFDERTFQILGRYIDMKYSNLFFSFNVQMNIEMNNFGGELLPVKITYQGNWDVPFHKEERASFLIVHKDYRKE